MQRRYVAVRGASLAGGGFSELVRRYFGGQAALERLPAGGEGTRELRLPERYFEREGFWLLGEEKKGGMLRERFGAFGEGH